MVLTRVETHFEEALAEGKPPGALWGIGIGVPGRSNSGRPPDLAPDHAGLGRLSGTGDASHIRRSRLDRQRCERDGARGADGRHRPRPRELRLSRSGPASALESSSEEEIHRGAQGCAGDIGHIQIVADREVICRCGNVNCLEALAGGGALARDGETAAREGRSPFCARFSGRRVRSKRRMCARRGPRGHREPRVDHECRPPCRPGSRRDGQLLQSVAHRHRWRRRRRR